MSRRTVASVLCALAALVVVLLVANAVFAWFVERRVETALENRLGSPTSVELSGFPVTPRLLTGSLPEAAVTVEDVGIPATSRSLGRLDLTFRDVRYTGERDGPLDSPIEARAARFESRLTEREVSALAGALPGVRGAELASGRPGLRLLLPGGVTADAGLAAEDGGLVLRPEPPLLDPELVLTPGGLPAGASIEEVSVGEKAVVIEGRADGLGV